jgi:hypothetical protein
MVAGVVDGQEIQEAAEELGHAAWRALQNE